MGCCCRLLLRNNVQVKALSGWFRLGISACSYTCLDCGRLVKLYSNQCSNMRLFARIVRLLPYESTRNRWRRQMANISTLLRTDSCDTCSIQVSKAFSTLAFDVRMQSTQQVLHPAFNRFPRRRPSPSAMPPSLLRCYRFTTVHPAYIVRLNCRPDFLFGFAAI